MSISDEKLGDHEGLGQTRHEIVLYYTYLAILSILFACDWGRLLGCVTSRHLVTLDTIKRSNLMYSYLISPCGNTVSMYNSPHQQFSRSMTQRTNH